ncbi:quinone oxidoreductase [Tothia fuscella]|uniref:Quinone oxidoreductase n=1 Tax=Tothia fuscella TaxID=1048955 RepID=A0A9P4P4C2_9PEZI|nr:quinone oxidoreductase [Tothia fuscella]
MKIAEVTEFGQPPKYVETKDPPVPASDSDLVQVKLLAAGVHVLVRLRAAGQHYTAQGLPHIPGTDAIGKTSDGQIVYYSTVTPKGGSFQELINLPKASLTPIPAGRDPIQLAGSLNPATSGWMALTTRTFNLPKNFSVLVMGATSTSGAIAIPLARALGAGKVIGCARNAAKMADLDLDEMITLAEPASKTNFSKAEDVDVILDYIYGEPAVHLLNNLKPTSPVQYVQIGSLSATEVNLSAAVLRSKDLTLRGAGPGSWSMAQMREQMPKLLEALVNVKPSKFSVVKLEDIESAWGRTRERLVVVP